MFNKNTHNNFFQQLTKVGLPMSVVSGMNPLSNGIINPAGKFAHQ